MSPTPLQILSVTSGRADVSILAPVWHALAADPGFDLHVFATGTHASGARLVGEAVPAGTSATWQRPWPTASAMPRG